MGKRSMRLGRPRGFTLIEIMVVVAIVGVLAVLAIVGYRRWALAARVNETRDLLRGLATGQKMYKDQTGGYLSCSSTYTDFYPRIPNAKKHTFHDPSHKAVGCWRLIGATIEEPTYMSFSVLAGVPGTQPPQPPTTMIFNWPVSNEPWFVLLAAGDMDEDKVYSYYVSASSQPDNIHAENEDE